MANRKIFDKEKIDLLNQKGNDRDCCKCGKEEFSLSDGYSYFPIDERVDVVFSERIIPAVLLLLTR